MNDDYTNKRKKLDVNWDIMNQWTLYVEVLNLVRSIQPSLVLRKIKI